MDALSPDAQNAAVRDDIIEKESEVSSLGKGGAVENDSGYTELESQWSTAAKGAKKKRHPKTKNIVFVSGYDEVPLENDADFVGHGSGSVIEKVLGISERFGPSGDESVKPERENNRYRCVSSSFELLSVDELEDDDNIVCAENKETQKDYSNSDAVFPEERASHVGETDEFDGVGHSVASVDGGGDANANVSSKRNRQISTDSSGSAANEAALSRQASKKIKKKIRQRNQGDEEIDRILHELAVGYEPDHPKPLKDVNIEHSTSDKIVENCGQSNKNKKNRKRITRKTLKMPSSENNGDRSSGDGVSPDIIDDDDQGTMDEISKTSYKADNRKDRKKPSKKQLEAIHQALKKAREEEERHKQEQISRQRKLEEAEKLRVESQRLEQEKKERKKQKVKDRKERLRAEGKLLTKSQKMARAKVEAALSAWREHGINVPQVGGKRTQSKENLGKSDSSHRPTESDTEPYSLMSASTISTDVDDHSCWEAADGETFGNSSAMSSVTDGKQRHLSDPVQDGVKGLLHLDNGTSFEPASELHNGARLRAKSAVDLRTSPEMKMLEEGLTRKLRKTSESSNDPSRSVLRSPVVCVLGHVDTGKTKILDKIRKTHVQDGEAGGITQQIGATMIPSEAIREKCGMTKFFHDFVLEIPGLLVIDTPGHEFFRNLRSLGSSLCDIAILVVDVMHGLEQQTLESIELLKQRKTPFIVALNKIDRLYGWQSYPDEDVADVVKRQSITTTTEFDKKCQQIVAEFANQGLNARLYYENEDPRSFISMVPVSAITGDGMGNLLITVARLCQTMLYKTLIFSGELKATVLEVKTIPGLGTTIDVILVNGHLREADTIIVAGQDGPIVTQIRSILMPQPLRELRVKNPYQEYKAVKGAQGIKISGKDLDKAMAGLPLFVAKRPDAIPDLKEKIIRLFRSTISSIKVSERGVYVQASTLGSLEALLDYLKSSGIPYAGMKVGPVVKKDVIRASVMLEHDIQYAVILAFDVKIERDAQELADHLGIKVFHANIIYHLFDRYVEYREELAEKKKNELRKLYVLPCKLSILSENVVSIRDPIVLGVRIMAGILKIGTPLCVPSKNFTDLGTVTSIRVRNQSLESAKEGDEVLVKIEPLADQSPKSYGKHFDHEDLLVSKISRQTIDVCKNFFREDLRKSDWQLMVELKKLFLIV